MNKRRSKKVDQFREICDKFELPEIRNLPWKPKQGCHVVTLPAEAKFTISGDTLIRIAHIIRALSDAEEFIESSEELLESYEDMEEPIESGDREEGGNGGYLH